MFHWLHMFPILMKNVQLVIVLNIDHESATITFESLNIRIFSLWCDWLLQCVDSISQQPLFSLLSCVQLDNQTVSCNPQNPSWCARLSCRDCHLNGIMYSLSGLRVILRYNIEALTVDTMDVSDKRSYHITGFIRVFQRVLNFANHDMIIKTKILIWQFDDHHNNNNKSNFWILKHSV